MPNLFAYFALFLWPVVAIILFRTMSRAQALGWTIIGGYLFLPMRAGFDLPLLPAVDKVLIPALSAWIGCIATQERRSVVATGQTSPSEVPMTRFVRGGGERSTAISVDGRTQRAGIPRKLVSRRALVLVIAMIIVASVATTLTNEHPVPAGPFMLPAMRPYDIGSLILITLVMLIPFLLGWRYLGTREGQRGLLAVFAVGGAIYAPLALLEIRLSPQLNTWVYGFFPHSFQQHMRGDGFRPLVFLEHGLWLAIFFAMSIIASVALWRLTPAGRDPFAKLRWLILAGALFVTLILSKSLGALVIALTVGTAALFIGRRGILTFAALVGMLVLLYPMLRGAGMIPTEMVVELAASVSEERAGSLQFRLDNEDLLLARANEQPLFGWGGWGRGLIYDQWGNRTSVSDGAWVIVMNGSGWAGYLLTFGLLCVPMAMCLRPSVQKRVGPEAAYVALLLAANLLDLIPNATLESVTWLLAGSFAGSLAVDARVPLSRSASPGSRRTRIAARQDPLRLG